LIVWDATKKQWVASKAAEESNFNPEIVEESMKILYFICVLNFGSEK